MFSNILSSQQTAFKISISTRNVTDALNFSRKSTFHQVENEKWTIFFAVVHSLTLETISKLFPKISPETWL